jgi:hypothetical protein
MRSLVLHYRGDRVKEGEIGVACSMHGRVGKWVQDLVRKSEGKTAFGKLWCR